MILNEHILRLFVKLAEELHFGRAAAMLHLSQSALSGTIKGLERDLGVRLLERTSRHVELTEAGRVFVIEARRLIREGERAIGRVRRNVPDALGPMRVGYPPSTDVRWLCGLIAQLRSEGLTTLEFQFVSAEAVDLQDGLIKRTLHAALLPDEFRDTRFRTVHLLREPLALVAHAKHWAAHAGSLTLDQLKDEPMVWLRRDLNPLLYTGFAAQCSSLGYHPSIVQEVRSFHECAEFAREAIGITFLPLAMQSQYAREPIRFVKVPGDPLYLNQTLAFGRGAQLGNFHRFIELVRDYASRHPCGMG